MPEDVTTKTIYEQLQPAIDVFQLRHDEAVRHLENFSLLMTVSSDEGKNTAFVHEACFWAKVLAESKQVLSALKSEFSEKY